MAHAPPAPLTARDRADRLTAIVAALRANATHEGIATVFGVSRQRIGQLLATAGAPSPRSLLTLEATAAIAAIARAVRAYRDERQPETAAAIRWPADRYGRVEQGRNRTNRHAARDVITFAAKTAPALGIAAIVLALEAGVPTDVVRDALDTLPE